MKRKGKICERGRCRLRDSSLELEGRLSACHFSNTSSANSALLAVQHTCLQRYHDTYTLNDAQCLCLDWAELISLLFPGVGRRCDVGSDFCCMTGICTSIIYTT